jgi:hypothetical protein
VAQARHESSEERQPILGTTPDSSAEPAPAADSEAASQGAPTHMPALPVWAARQLAAAAAICLAGGTLAGMLGLGGGMVRAGRRAALDGLRHGCSERTVQH